jgi:hypothetical protein
VRPNDKKKREADKKGRCNKIPGNDIRNQTVVRDDRGRAGRLRRRRRGRSR